MDQSEQINKWGSFIWRSEDNGVLTEVDPFFISGYGIQIQEAAPKYTIWMTVVGFPASLFKQFNIESEAKSELDRIRNAKMRN